ncbi:hypothetical protein HanIR_Chr12g0602051 [Helianthus annuus]|nr:hypothetical protein HanIR_Chr12g0602051 [Helianthus annuus]
METNTVVVNIHLPNQTRPDQQSLKTLIRDNIPGSDLSGNITKSLVILEERMKLETVQDKSRVVSE